METYTISKGNQYDGQNGYRITNGINWGWGVVEPDGRVAVAGNCGQQPYGVTDAEWDTVRDAIRSTMADGVGRTVEIGTAPPAVKIPAWRSERGLTLNQEMDREDTIY